MAELLRGAPVARAMTETLRARSGVLFERGVTPCLALLRVGEREADLAYERGALKRCEQTGVTARRIVLAENASQSELLATISGLNADPSVHGILLLRPLPERFDDAAVCAAVAPAKDVEGVTAASMASLYAGFPTEGFAPCTAEACLALLRHYDVSLPGRRALVIGRSLVIGRPAAMLLLSEDMTVTIAHTKTGNLAKLCRDADVLLVATGARGLIGREHVREGQTVIDVGIHANADGSLCGDVRFDEVEPVVRSITPVPGGIGAITTAVLCSHVIRAAENAAHI